jgi:hypothetical protein
VRIGLKSSEKVRGTGVHLAIWEGIRRQKRHITHRLVLDDEPGHQNGIGAAVARRGSRSAFLLGLSKATVGHAHFSRYIGGAVFEDKRGVFVDPRRRQLRVEWGSDVVAARLTLR